jgi:cytochrome c biogenesis protein
MAATAQAASPARPTGPDPFRTIWNLLTNVKFAVVLVGSAAFAGLLGVVFPQLPGPMRTNATARAAWIEAHRGDFGVFTTPLDRLGLFDVFHTAWFNGLWLVVIIAVTVCTVSRFRPTLRSVRSPTKQVADSYFDHAHHRAAFTHPGGVDAVEGLLRKKRFRVERTRANDGATYLFAERFSWSQYGTFLSHLALLMLLVGALLTRFAGFDRTLVLADGTPAFPVFDNPGPGQVFVKMLDAHRGTDANGNVIDFHSALEVRKGDQVVRCTATVNSPCSAFGYKIHQAAFFNDVANFRVTDSSGHVIYNNVLDFQSQTTAVPVMRVTAPDGTVVFDQELPELDTQLGLAGDHSQDVALSLLSFPKAAGSSEIASYSVAWRVVNNQLRVALTLPSGDTVEVPQGSPLAVDGYQIDYRGADTIPAIRVNDIPGAITDDKAVAVQMPTDRTGQPYLVVSGVDANNLFLQPNSPVLGSGGYSYAFAGRLDASGISVKRDPGGTFIWIAVAMALIGLSITFYIPRRRLWVKVTPTRTMMAGIAERTTRFGRELRMMGAALGSEDALLPGDLTDPD